MAKTIISLVLTLVFMFLCLSAYAATDAPRMRQWLAYYEEYQMLRTQGDIDDKTKITLLEQLCQLYPEKAALYETKFKEEFGDLESRIQAAEEKKAAEEKAQAEAEEQQRELANEKARLEEAREQLRREQEQQKTQAKSAQKKTTPAAKEKNNR